MKSKHLFVRYYNNAIFKAIVSHLESLGYKKMANVIYTADIGILHIYNSEKEFSIYSHSIEEEYKTAAYNTYYSSEFITVDDVFCLLPIFTPIKVHLNTEYSAIVEEKCVRVGCQTFSFDAIKNLYDAVKEVESKK